MKLSIHQLLTSFFAIILATLSCKTSPAELVISEVWSRPALAAQDSSEKMNYTAVVYCNIMNNGGTPDRLLTIQTNIAERAEMHLTQVENGVMKMAHLQNGVEIPPGGSVQFKPGSYHIMLIGLKRSLESGQTFDVILEFERSGKKRVTSEVKDN